MKNQKISIIILAASHDAQNAFQIANLVTSYTGEDLCRICCDRREVQAARLKSSGYCCGAVVLAGNGRELDQWVGLAPLLNDLAVMVRLPDGGHHTIAKAHRLRPRYLMTPDINYEELLTVIGDILAQHRIPGAVVRDHGYYGVWGLPRLNL